MQKLFIGIILLSSLTLEAKSIDAFIKAYKEKKYESVCKEGLALYYGGRHNEHFVALVGSACAHTDTINPLGLLQRHLISNANLRETASYFSTLILQKRLLLQFMADNSTLRGLTLPYSGHILSFVFENISSGNYVIIKKKPKMVKIEQGGRTVLVFLNESEPINVQVDEFEEGKLSKRHWFQ